MAVTQPIGPLFFKMSDGNSSPFSIANNVCTISGIWASHGCSIDAAGNFTMVIVDAGVYTITFGGTFESNTLANGTFSLTYTDPQTAPRGGTWTADLEGNGRFKVPGVEPVPGTYKIEGNPGALTVTFTFSNGESIPPAPVDPLTGAINASFPLKHGYVSLDGTFVSNEKGSGYFHKDDHGKRTSDSWEADSSK